MASFLGRIIPGTKLQEICSALNSAKSAAEAVQLLRRHRGADGVLKTHGKTPMFRWVFWGLYRYCWGKWITIFDPEKGVMRCSRKTRPFVLMCIIKKQRSAVMSTKDLKSQDTLGSCFSPKKIGETFANPGGENRKLARQFDLADGPPLG